MWSQSTSQRQVHVPFDRFTSVLFSIDLLTIFFSAFHIERFNESELIEAERSHLQRESLVRHLYDSEEDYLRSLQEIQSCYQQPLLHNLEHPDAGKKTLLGAGGAIGKPVATKEEIEVLFGNLDQLVAFHEGIRTMLEGRSKIWGPSQIMSDLLLSVVRTSSPLHVLMLPCFIAAPYICLMIYLKLTLKFFFRFSLLLCAVPNNNRFQGSRSTVRTLRTFMRLSSFWTESQGHPNIKSLWR